MASPGHLPRLVMVAYTADRTSSGSIAKRVNSSGLRARIVGCA
ncbi:MAG: hypothetical protein ACM3ST_17195 [Bdellovibrio bacteriovorus]